MLIKIHLEKKGQKTPFSKLTQIQTVLVSTLKQMNKTYTDDDFKDDMAKHIMKYAYLNAVKK